MASLDRGELIALLDRLGAEDDAEALEAARALHRTAQAAGRTWDELIRDDPISEDSGEDARDEPEEEAPSRADTPETARLIDALLRKDLSDALRADLLEMKRNIALGEFDGMDGRYVRALARRLGA